MTLPRKLQLQMRSFARIFFGVLIGFPLVFLGILYFFQDRLLFMPPPVTSLEMDWVRRQFPDAEIRLKTPDHITLHGWYVPAQATVPSPLLIYFGGNAQDATHVLYDTAFEKPTFAGWSLLMVNYRGYGLSEGAPSEKALFNDAVFVYDQFVRRREVDPNRIVCMGRSLGTGVAVYLASQRKVAGVILISPYDSMVNVARDLYPYAPVKSMLNHPFEVAPLAGRIDAPLLALTAAQDSTIHPARSAALIDAWRGPHRHVVIARADHNDLGLSDRYWESIAEFLVSVESD